jgi:hypothetical protein
LLCGTALAVQPGGEEEGKNGGGGVEAKTVAEPGSLTLLGISLLVGGGVIGLRKELFP